MLQSSLLVLASFALFQEAGSQPAQGKPAAPAPDSARLPIAVLGTKALRTGGLYHAMTYVADDRLAGAWEGSVELWQDGKQVLQPPAFSRSIVIPAPDGRTAARIIEGRRITLWEIATSNEIRPFRGEAGPIAGAVWSPCGKLLAAGVGPVVFLWDADTGKVRRVLTGDSAEHPALAFSPDGTKLAGGDREAAQIWDVATGVMLAKLEGGFSSAAASVAFSPDNTVLVGCCHQPMAKNFGRVGLRQWDAVTGKTIRDLEFGSFSSVVVVPDGNDIYAAADRFIYHYHLRSGKQARRWLAHTGGVRLLAVTRDGTRMVSTGADRRLRFWDLANEHEPTPGHVGPVLAVDFSPDGRVIASGGEDRTLRLWDARSGKPLRCSTQVDSDWGVGQLAFAPDGKTVVTAEIRAAGSTLRLWNAESGMQMAQADAKTQGQFAFGRDGRWFLAAGADGKIGRWDAGTLSMTETLTGFANPVAAVNLSQDGRILAWRGSGRGYGVRDLQTRADLVRSDEQVSTVILSRDGLLMAVNAGRSVILWDTANRRIMASWTPDFDIPPGGLAFSPDGSLLAAAMPQGVVLWEAIGGAELARFPSDQGGIRRLAFAPDGRRLVCGAEEGVLLLWDVVGPWQTGKSAAANLSKEDLLGQATLLRGGDAVRAQTAIWTLAAAGPDAVPLVEALLPDPEMSGKIKRWIRDLSDPVFTVRNEATKQLTAVADEAELSLQEALAANPELETRRRVELLLRKIEQNAIAKRPVQVRRALAVLEHAGVEEARSALERFARAAPHDPWVPTVQVILRRLNLP